MRIPKKLAVHVDRDGNKFLVQVGWTKTPAATTYATPAWWAYTSGRGNELEIAGPCRTQAELIDHLRLYKAEQRY